MNPDITILRLKRRIEKKNKTILGQQRKIQELESALATRTLDLGNLSRNIRKEVQDALCNVRLIPINSSLKTVNIKINEN